MDIKFNVKFNVNTKVRCASCKQDFPASLDTKAEFVAGNCPHCGAPYKIPSAALGEIAKRISGVEEDVSRSLETGGITGGKTTTETIRRTYTTSADAGSGYPRDYSRPQPYSEGYKRAAKYLNFSAFPLALWLLVFPRPYIFAAGAASFLPLAAIYLIVKSEGVVRLYDDNKAKWPHVAVAFLLPPAVLAFRALTYFHILSFSALLTPMLVVTVPVTLAAYRYAPDLREVIWKKAATLFVVLMLSFGASIVANCWFDGSETGRYSVTVMDKRISHSTKGGNTYYLTLPAWGPVTEQADVSVRRSFYDSLKKGDAISITAKPGALGIPWYRITK